MNAVSKQPASNARKTQSHCGQFETLESRQLMSASLSHAATPAPVEVKDALHVHAGQGSLLNVTSLHIVYTPIKYYPPTLFVEPKVNGSVTGWKNVSKNPLFAPGGPSANDVIQNQAADCWFLSSLAEVAIHDPSRIESLIHQRADGTYDVDFYSSPTKTVDEHVDGLLPVNGGGGLEYAQLGQGGCTWAAIMEKAFTYFRNRSIAASYNTINYGWGREALADLGGTYTEVLPKVSNASQLFSDVVLGLIFNTAIDFGTVGSGGPLVNNHEYSVISAEVTKAGVDEIEVRNPWGYNPNFTANKNGYGATNNGYMWVSASSVLPELDEFVTASV